MKFLGLRKVRPQSRLGTPSQFPDGLPRSGAQQTQGVVRDALQTRASRYQVRFFFLSSFI